MKTLRFRTLLSLGCLALGSAVGSSVLAQSPTSAYEKAVADYVDAATKELAALREQGEAAVKAGTEKTKDAYQPFFKRLDRADRALEKLKGATSQTFDKYKAEFEKVRGEAVKALGEAQKG